MRPLILALGLSTYLSCPVVAADLYVSAAASGGNGTQASPFSNLEQARDAVRNLGKSEPITVWLAGGKYFVSKPIEFLAQDSGGPKAPVCYRAMNGAAVEIIKARILPATDFQTVSDADSIDRLSPEARGKVIQLDLATLGLSEIKNPPDVYDDIGGIPDLFYNEQRLPLSRFPKEGFMTMKEVINPGEKGVKSAFHYRDENQPQFERWAKALDHGIWLKGYWRVMWENEAIKIGKIDTSSHSVTFAVAVQNGIGNKFHRPKGDGKEQYWSLNLLEEITQPGEWCLDFKNQKIYLYPPTSVPTAQLYLADSPGAIFSLNNASNITFRGLTLECNLGEGIVVHGGENVLIAGCTLKNLDKDAVKLQGGKSNEVLSCDLYNLGAAGVDIEGGEDETNPRVPCGHQVINNHIFNFAQISRTYSAAVNCGYTGGIAHRSAVGNLIAHNLIHDTPHVGVLFGSYDNVFEYNEIFRYALTSNDIGGFYTYQLYKYMGNDTFRYNFIHSTSEGDGFYFDWDHPNMHLYGNIVCLQTSSSASKGTGFLYKVGSQMDPKYDSDPLNSQPLDCYNNLVLQCGLGCSFWIPKSAPSHVENNVVVGCNKAYRWTSLGDKKAATSDETLVAGKNMNYVSDPGFVDAAHFDFNLKPDAQLLKDLPTFQPIPMNKIGLYLDEYRTRLPTADEIDRYSTKSKNDFQGYGVEDRK